MEDNVPLIHPLSRIECYEAGVRIYREMIDLLAASRNSATSINEAERRTLALIIGHLRQAQELARME